jgi:hypothetical protein
MEGMKRHIPRWRGWAHLWSVLSLFVIAASWGGWAWLAISDHREIAELKAQIEWQKHPPAGLHIKHGVQILERVNALTFHAQVQDTATGEWEKFDITSCPGHPLTTKEIQAGVTLPLLQWYEDYEHSCQIVDGHWGGYSLLRDRGKPILTAFTEEP